MNHRDAVAALPAGFRVTGRTDTCAVAAIAAPERQFYGVQFHPEVVHTARGDEYLSNFVFRVCGCVKDWDPRHRVARHRAGDPRCRRRSQRLLLRQRRRGFQRGVCAVHRALGADRVRGVYVDTGLMREGETEFVGALPRSHCRTRRRSFLGALASVTDPERKRHIIGEEFVRVQERIIESAPPSGRELDSRTGHHLSRYHRIRRRQSTPL